MGKMAGYHIVEMTNTHPDFYRTVGPFLARRAISKEIGDVIWDDDGKLWLLAYAPDGTLAGFATMLPKSYGVLFCEAYVLPAHRDQGVYARLIDERLARCPAGAAVRVVVKASSVKYFQARGFALKRQRGKLFTEWEKTLEAAHE